jgi:hypothetical protein
METAGFSVIVDTADFVPSAALVAVTVTVVVVAMLAGAVYVIEVPDVEVVALSVPAPVAGLMVQVTPVFVLFVTVAVMPCVWPADKLAVVGETEIVTAGRLIVYAADDTALLVMPLL